MEKIDEKDEENYTDKKQDLDDNPEIKCDNFNDVKEEPLRQTFLRESDLNQESDVRYTCVEGKNYDFDEGNNNNNNNPGSLYDKNEEPEEMEEFDILMIGDPEVGKTSIIQRFNNNTFNINRESIKNEENYEKCLKLDQNTSVKLKIKDIVGNSSIGQVPKQMYRDVHGVIIVFDITNKDSINTINNWIKNVRDESPKDVVIFIVGNKCDLQGMRKISSADIHMIAQKNNLIYYEVSAKNGNNIALVFEDLANQISQKQKENIGPNRVERKKERKSLGLNEFNNTSNIKNKCCK